jgi:hypothetical protein
MLNNSYTLGTSGNAAAYLKQFDTETASHFAVSGLALNAQQKMRVGHETSNSGKLRGDIVELTYVKGVPSSPTGEVRTDRCFITMKRSEFTTLAEYLAYWERLKTVASDVAFQTKLFDGEL